MVGVCSRGRRVKETVRGEKERLEGWIMKGFVGKI